MGRRVIKAGKDLAGGTVGLTAAGIAGKYAPVAKQTAEHVFDNLVERVAPGMTPKSLDPAALGDKIISAIDNATAHKVIPPAPPVPKGMSLPAKLALGAATLGTTGLLGYGATRGYVNMNKEAFAKSLLEQGYSVEDTLALVKEAKEKDNSYGATLSNDIRTGARVGFGVGGLMGGGLGLLATNAARAANPNLSKLHYLTSGLLGAGVVGGATALPAAVGGALFSVPHQAGKYLFNKEAYAKGLLEQGYSVEDTLALVKEASLLGKIKELPERYARGAVLTATAPLAIPAAHSMDMVRAVRRAQGLGHEGEDIAKYTNAVTGDIKTFIGGTGALAAAGYAAKKLLDRAAANKASRMAAESIKQEAVSGMSNADKALLGAAGSIGAGTSLI
jgi:predicted RNase H-like HicB family nuclease